MSININIQGLILKRSLARQNVDKRKQFELPGSRLRILESDQGCLFVCSFSCRTPAVWLYCTNTCSYCCHTPPTSSHALSSSSRRAPGTAAYERSCKVTDLSLAADASSPHCQHFLVGLVLKQLVVSASHFILKGFHPCLKPSSGHSLTSPKLLVRSQSTSTFYTRFLLSSVWPPAPSVEPHASCQGLRLDDTSDKLPVHCMASRIDKQSHNHYQSHTPTNNSQFTSHA